MRLPHDAEAFSKLRAPTAHEPLRLLVSGCLAGRPCGVDGSDYGLNAPLRDLLALPSVSVVSFCPEEFAMGTPRTMPDIHGGDGHDVLDGRARVIDEHGTDLTEKMIAGAKAMLETALAHRVELALLTDMSAACGSQVISLGCRLVEKRRFTASVGVATALLLRNGVSVLSQRDNKTLGKLRALLDPSFTPDPAARDYHEVEWYVATFGNP
jgi:uncharacterized protein YbbK (DUF523 family)